MQGEAYLTRTCIKMPFHLLVAVNNSGNANGEVFLDDEEELEMGKDGGNWSLVKFSSELLGDEVKIKSEVVNGKFAVGQKWIIEKMSQYSLDVWTLSLISITAT
ncbi:hypothetical protein IFM89_028480 [Coptis chinensis]|uniref:Uncharacterized protein n=1 Tax=Coptis chinensis TaxID=261450 RepID=A0A835M9Z2_9MAGN|nr:hypothetical protein IFM89_028480 [Coptis chinensis]